MPPDLMESELFGHARGAFTGATQQRQGLFVEANGGTLLLDEIGEMQPDTQAKLLRVLEDGRVRPLGSDREVSVDVRLVAATNRDLEADVQAGRFREDLFFRLEAFPLHVPPLRARGDDLDLLAARFIARFAAIGHRPPPHLSDAAMDCLRAYPFPGNVRELANAMERATAFCDGREIRPAQLPERIRHRQQADGASEAVVSPLLASEELPSLDEMERRYIRLVLERTRGNKRQAAAVLGIGRRTLYRRLDEGL
jgi:DNA-binding NtrC family response regulator